MSCGEAAVPTLTSVERERERELLILSRVWPKGFGSTGRTYRSSSPSAPPSRTSCFSQQPKSRNTPSFSSHSYWMRTLLPFRCNNNGGQTRSAVSARLHLGYFVSLKGSLDPMDLLRSDAKWSVCPGPTAAIYFTERYVEPRDGYSIIFSFAWHVDWELQWSQKIRGLILQMDYVVHAPPSEQRLKCTGSTHP